MMAQHVRSAGGIVHFAVLAPSARLNPALHSRRSLHGKEDILSLLQAVVHEKDVDFVHFIDFTRVIEQVSAIDEEAISWRAYISRKYIEPLNRGAAAANKY
jgi:hypothetical protein